MFTLLCSNAILCAWIAVEKMCFTTAKKKNHHTFSLWKCSHVGLAGRNYTLVHIPILPHCTAMWSTFFCVYTPKTIQTVRLIFSFSMNYNDAIALHCIQNDRLPKHSWAVAIECYWKFSKEYTCKINKLQSVRFGARLNIFIFEIYLPFSLHALWWSHKECTFIQKCVQCNRYGCCSKNIAAKAAETCKLVKPIEAVGLSK